MKGCKWTHQVSGIGVMSPPAGRCREQGREMSRHCFDFVSKQFIKEEEDFSRVLAQGAPLKPSNTNPKSATASRDFCSPPVDMGTVTVFLEGTGNKSRGIVAEGLFFFKKRFSHAFFMLSARFGDQHPKMKVFPSYPAPILNLSRAPCLFSVKNFTGGKQHLGITYPL